jgi:hypothetical protein
MRVVFLLALIAVLGIASAETIQFGNYTANFEMLQPHIISEGKIKTYDGWIKAIEYNNVNVDKSIRIGELNISGSSATLRLFEDHSGYQTILKKYPIFILSTMNLTSTLDFLKTLKIEKTNSTKPTSS